MTSVALTAPPRSDVNPKRALLWAIICFLAASAVLMLMTAWALDTDISVGRLFDVGTKAAGNSMYVIYAAALGFFGGLLGGGMYRRPNIWRAALWTSFGYIALASVVMLIRMAFGMDAYSQKPVLVFGSVGSMFGFLGGLGSFDYWLHYVSGRPTPLEEDHSNHGAQRWTDYFKFNTDHKVIGIQYIVTTFCFMVVGGLMAMMIRAELAQPHLQYVTSGQSYNALFSVHAIIMIFMFIIPVFAGIANYVVPLMLGAPDMAFPRLNALSFWVLLFGGMTFLSSFLIGAFGAGWTAYAPLSSSHSPTGQVLFSIGVQIVGASSIMTAINFVVTIIAMRAPGLTMWRLPLLVWANLTTSLLVIFATPFIAGSQFMVLFDSVMHTNFFNASTGGDPIMYQHVFWFYSHPAVYIMMLPGFGIISEVISSHARKPIFGYKALAASTVAIGFRAFISWTFQPGNTPIAQRLQSGDVPMYDSLPHKPTPFDYLLTQAVSRIFLDNVQNIQSSWVTQGMKVGQAALFFGANDLGSIMIEENVVSSAGTTYRASVEDFVQAISATGMKAVQRDTLYRTIKEHSL